MALSSIPPPPQSLRQDPATLKWILDVIQAATTFGAFTDLTDTPVTLTADQFAKANAGGTALEFATVPPGDWTDLDDTPGSITALQHVRGNAGGTALEFAPIADNTIQEVYAASTDAEIDLTAAIGPVVFKDAATPTGDVLFSVQENDGTPIIQAGVDFDEGITFGKLRDDAGSPAIKIFQSPDAFQSINIWPESMTFSQTFGSGINFGDHTKTYTLNQNSGSFQGINQRGFYVHQSSTSASFYSVIMNASGQYKNGSATSLNFGPIMIARTQVNVQADTQAVTATLVAGIDMNNVFFGTTNGGALTVSSYTGLRMKGDNHLFATVDRRVGLDFDNANLGFGTLTDNVAVDIANLNYGTNRFGIRSVMAVGYFLHHTGAAPSLLSTLEFTGRLDANTTTVTGTSHTAGVEHVILVDDDTAGSTVTVTLPTAATSKAIYHVKKLGTTANVIVDGNGAETIDGAANATMTTQYENIMLVSDGSAWHVI